ncbi:MAG: hypothetical protein JSS49_10645 [Planctomycetes bacterium]|nr:hypothetical protein [Planctomycetota bacterium]
MNGARKAAVLLTSLDRDLAAQILALLPRDQVERATLAIANAANPAAEELSCILVEFKAKLKSRAELARESLIRPQIDSPPLESSRHFQPAPAAKSPASYTVPLRSDADDSDGGPFGFLNGRHPDDVLQLLNDEQPQTIAVVAAQLNPAFSAAILAGLAPDRQAEVLQRIARLGPTDAEILSDIAAAMQDRLGRPRVRAGGVPRVAAVLRETSRAASRSILDSMEEHDSNLADELRQTLFSFDDLLRLDDDTLRIILQETDDRPWALALKASPEVVRQKVLGCLSERVALALRDEMDSLGPIRLSEMTTVRQQIADSIRRLEDAGMIALPVN